MINSSSTDCISSEEGSLNSGIKIPSTNRNSHVNRSFTKITTARESTKKSSNSIEYKNNPNDDERLKVKENSNPVKSSLSTDKLFKNQYQNHSNFKITQYVKENENKLSFKSSGLEFFNLDNKKYSNIETNNEFIVNQQLRNELEKNFLKLIKEKSNITLKIDMVQDSISERINENKKISIMNQRYSIQKNSTNKEVKELKDELIRVNYRFIK